MFDKFSYYPRRSDTSVSPKSSSSSFLFLFIAGRLPLLPPALGAVILIGLSLVPLLYPWLLFPLLLLLLLLWALLLLSSTIGDCLSAFTAFGLSDLWGAAGPLFWGAALPARVEPEEEQYFIRSYKSDTLKFTP